MLCKHKLKKTKQTPLNNSINKANIFSKLVQFHDMAWNGLVVMWCQHGGAHEGATPRFVELNSFFYNTDVLIIFLKSELK